MTRLIVGEITSGRRIIPIPASSGDWEIRRNRAGSISCDVTLSSKAHRRLDLRQNAARGRAFLAIAEGERVLEAGPIWDHDYDDDTRRLTISAEGMWSLLMRRFIMPAAVETVSLLITSGDDEGKPNPAVATVFTGKSWPFIVRSILQQGLARAGGALPLVFGPDGVGAHDKKYDSASFKPQGQGLEDLTQLVNGPEIEFRGGFTGDGLGLQWNVLVGDDSKLEISNVGQPHRFDFSAQKRTVRRLRVKSSARDMSMEAWGTGGRQAAIALISRVASDMLIDAGYPRMESLSNAHSTVEDQATLDAHAADELALGSAPAEWWSFDTHMDAIPTIGSLGLGDYCDVITRGNAYLPDGKHRRRIAAMSGSLRSRWVKITTDEVLGWS
ncbi:hypothetical protein ACFWWU_36540 [Streptomyces sp. NPDC058650]|uniref:hypothetical protein n=1 Tax=Streptomyces sp. NPDC058650 TaxID=3346575 RepID=UPI003657AE87